MIKTIQFSRTLHHKQIYHFLIDKNTIFQKLNGIVFWVKRNWLLHPTELSFLLN